MHSSDPTQFRLSSFRLLLILLVFAVYAQTAAFDFIAIDDPVFVTRNPYVLGGLSPEGLGWALTNIQAANWMPLTWASLMLDVTLFGNRPGLFHLQNVLWHLLATLFLLEFLVAASGRPWASLWAAALFALHPAHVESVAWVSERKDVLSALFWMMTCLAYVHYARSGGKRRYALVVVVYALGLMTKPMLITLPFVLCVLDVWPLGRARTLGWRKLVLEKVPLLALSLGVFGIAFLSQARGGAVSSLAQFPLFYRLAHVAQSYIEYLGKILWPIDLAVFYPFADSIDRTKAALSAVLLGLLTVGAVLQARKRPYWLTGWLWYLITLVPVIGLITLGSQRIADRYTYLPSIGIFFAAACAASEWASRSQARQTAVRMAGLFTVLACASLSFVQTGYWRETTLLLNRALKVTGGNSFVHSVLGRHWAEAGDLKKAAQHYEQAIGYRPLPETRHDLATTYLRMGRTLEAALVYESVVAENPNQGFSWYGLGIAYDQNGRLEDAERAFLEAMRLLPGYAPAHSAYAQLLQRQGKERNA